MELKSMKNLLDNIKKYILVDDELLNLLENSGLIIDREKGLIKHNGALVCQYKTSDRILTKAEVYNQVNEYMENLSGLYKTNKQVETQFLNRWKGDNVTETNINSDSIGSGDVWYPPNNATISFDDLDQSLRQDINIWRDCKNEE